MKHILMTLSVVGLLAGTAFNADAYNRGKHKAKGHHKACCSKSKSCCKKGSGSCHKKAEAHK